MRLGPRSLLFLELFFSAGIDALASLSAPYSRLAKGSGWEDEAILLKHLRRMEKYGLVEFGGDQAGGEWVVRLTQQGARQVSDGIDPVARWAAAWDGVWYLLSYDLPSSARQRRYELKSWLDGKRFGKLQGSVRLTPTFSAEWRLELKGLKVAPSCLLIFAGRPVGAASDSEIVAEAWNFDAINAAYRKLIAFHEMAGASLEETGDLNRWLEKERELWRKAFELDPFLPEVLLPAGYLGQEAWNVRRESLRAMVTAEG